MATSTRKKRNGEPFSVKRFVTAITCRVDQKLTPETSKRLTGIVEENAHDHTEYRAALKERDIDNLARWSANAPLDFFMSAWPKEIARLALNKQWDVEVHNHAFYDRVNEKGEPYHMVCLVVEFNQAPFCSTYLSAATNALDQNARTEIQRVEETDLKGKALLADLREIVILRNKQAKRFAREELPEPLAEINRLRAEGVPI